MRSSMAWNGPVGRHCEVGVIGGGHGHSPYCWVSVSHVTSGSASRAAAIDAFHVSERDCHSLYSKSNCSCVLPATACS